MIKNCTRNIAVASIVSLLFTASFFLHVFVIFAVEILCCALHLIREMLEMHDGDQTLERIKRAK